MNLEQQWQDDINKFGDMAYLMYSIFNAEQGYITPKSNDEVIQEGLFLRIKHHLRIDIDYSKFD